MRRYHDSLAALSLAASLLSQSPVSAAAPESTLAKVRAQGYVQCGSKLRPGLAMTDDKGHWSGLEVEMCRAIAVAVFGPNGTFAYHEYESDQDFDPAREGTDQVSFLTFSEMSAQHLTDKILPGPTVFLESHDLLVAQDSPAQHLADVAGKGVCFIIQTASNESLDAWFEERKIPITREAYQEDQEMYDAYAVQKCPAMAEEATTLAEVGRYGGVNHLKSRLLPDHLDVYPIVAATPMSADSQWAAIVAWTIDTLKNADAHETTYRANGLRAMPVEGPGLDLDKEWQSKVVATVGSYSAIFRRALGADSPLKLEPGLNASPADGGALFVAHKD